MMNMWHDFIRLIFGKSRAKMKLIGTFRNDQILRLVEHELIRDPNVKPVKIVIVFKDKES